MFVEARILQKMRNWMILQKEFGEEWILTEQPEILNKVHRAEGISLGSIATKEQPSQKKSTIVPNSPAARSPSLLKETTPATTTAVDAASLDDLKEQLFSFNGCSLKKMATHTVFADGDPHSPLMFVGEAPGADEDLQGIPFVGASGQLLNKMLAAIHIRRPDVYITNVVNWRPPGNRPPTPDEIALCLPFLERHIALIAPKFLVLLGGTAMKAVLRRTGSLSQARGVWHLHTPVPGAEPIRTLVTFHPSYLLRSPGQKTLAWQDLQMLQTALHKEGLFLDSTREEASC